MKNFRGFDSDFNILIELMVATRGFNHLSSNGDEFFLPLNTFRYAPK